MQDSNSSFSWGTTMKSTICLALAMVLFGACSYAHTSHGSENENSSHLDPGFSLAVTPPANPLSLRSPINITITVKNITDKDIFWSSETGPDNAYMAFRYLLKKDGREVETTFFHRVITGRQRQGDPAAVYSGSSILFPKPPGIMFVMTVDLRRLYEITEPGQYELDISRFTEDNKTVVRANTVTLNIVP
jgi:hypothetical protein